MAKKREKWLIGRSDIIDLPEFKLYDIPAKVDTGAFTSAIHTSSVKVKEVDGVKYVFFKIPAAKKKGKVFQSSHYEERRIRSSNGHIEKRYVITTEILIFGKLQKTEFSLADRSAMKYPILLGRKLLSKRFVVDVSKKNLSYVQKTAST